MAQSIRRHSAKVSSYKTNVSTLEDIKTNELEAIVDSRGDSILHWDSGVHDAFRILIFTTRPLLQLLLTAIFLAMDGTFEVIFIYSLFIHIFSLRPDYLSKCLRFMHGTEIAIYPAPLC